MSGEAERAELAARGASEPGPATLAPAQVEALVAMMQRAVTLLETLPRLERTIFEQSQSIDALEARIAHAEETTKAGLKSARDEVSFMGARLIPATMAAVIGEVQDIRLLLEEATRGATTATKPVVGGPGRLAIEPGPSPAPTGDSSAGGLERTAPADPAEGSGGAPLLSVSGEAAAQETSAAGAAEGYPEVEAANAPLDVTPAAASGAAFDGFSIEFDDLDDQSAPAATEDPPAAVSRSTLTNTEIAELESLRAHAERSVEATLRLDRDPFKSNVVSRVNFPAESGWTAEPGAVAGANPDSSDPALEPERESFEARLARLRAEKRDERAEREETAARNKPWLARLFRR